MRLPIQFSQPVQPLSIEVISNSSDSLVSSVWLFLVVASSPQSLEKSLVRCLAYFVPCISTFLYPHIFNSYCFLCVQVLIAYPDLHIAFYQLLPTFPSLSFSFGYFTYQVLSPAWNASSASQLVENLCLAQFLSSLTSPLDSIHVFYSFDSHTICGL